MEIKKGKQYEAVDATALRDEEGVERIMSKDFFERYFISGLPTNWVVKGDKNGIPEVKNYANSQRVNPVWWEGNDPKGFYGCINGDYNCFMQDELTPDTVILTLEEFKNIVKATTETTEIMTQKITRENFKEIVDIACSDWKSKLTKVARDNSDPLSSFVELEPEFVTSMFNAATATQLPILKKYLKVVEVDNIAIPKGVDFSSELEDLNKKVFGGGGMAVINQGATKPEYKGRGIYVASGIDVVVSPSELGGTEIVFLKRN